MLIRYEDLCEHPLQIVKELLNFLELPQSQEVMVNWYFPLQNRFVILISLKINMKCQGQFFFKSYSWVITWYVSKTFERLSNAV